VFDVTQFLTSHSPRPRCFPFLTFVQEYLDEAADIASICMFALFVSSVLSASALVSQLFNNIHPYGDNGKAVNISPQNMAVAAVVAIIAIVLLKTPQDLPPFEATSLFKHVMHPPVTLYRSFCGHLSRSHFASAS
jgi:hypothetical protein